MMAIHHTVQLLTTTYRDEPTHIFTNSLNVLYILNIHIKHLTPHNSYPNKNILEDMIKMIISLPHTNHRTSQNKSPHKHQWQRTCRHTIQTRTWTRPQRCPNNIRTHPTYIILLQKRLVALHTSTIRNPCFLLCPQSCHRVFVMSWS